jgi:hypothetical protein
MKIPGVLKPDKGAIKSSFSGHFIELSANKKAPDSSRMVLYL